MNPILVNLKELEDRYLVVSQECIIKREGETFPEYHARFMAHAAEVNNRYAGVAWAMKLSEFKAFCARQNVSASFHAGLRLRDLEEFPHKEFMLVKITHTQGWMWSLIDVKTGYDAGESITICEMRGLTLEELIFLAAEEPTMCEFL